MDLFFQCGAGGSEVVLSPAGSGVCYLFHCLCCRIICFFPYTEIIVCLIFWSEITLRETVVPVKW